jgi:hypothetical protein
LLKVPRADYQYDGVDTAGRDVCAPPAAVLIDTGDLVRHYAASGTTVLSRPRGEIASETAGTAPPGSVKLRHEEHARNCRAPLVTSGAAITSKDASARTPVPLLDRTCRRWRPRTARHDINPAVIVLRRHHRLFRAATRLHRG